MHLSVPVVSLSKKKKNGNPLSPPFWKFQMLYLLSNFHQISSYYSLNKKKKRKKMFVKQEHVPSRKPLSQGTYMSNMKALSEMVKKLWPMLIFLFKVGHRWRSRSLVKFFCMSGKPLSQGTYMPNMKVLSERVQNLWPMLKLSNKQTGQKQNVPAA